MVCAIKSRVKTNRFFLENPDQGNSGKYIENFPYSQDKKCQNIKKKIQLLSSPVLIKPRTRLLASFFYRWFQPKSPHGFLWVLQFISRGYLPYFFTHTMVQTFQVQLMIAELIRWESNFDNMFFCRCPKKSLGIKCSQKVHFWFFWLFFGKDFPQRVSS